MNYREEAYLMHYGIPGMKWGKRMAKSSANYAKSYAKYGKNLVKRPVITAKAGIKDNKNSDILTLIRKKTIGYSQKEIDAINSNVSKMIKENNKKKRDIFIKSIDKDINSFTPHLTTGISTIKGKQIFSPKEVKEMQDALIEVKKKTLASKWND